ncbi:MAG: hypothetical protein AVDCRST_MAG88-2443, partial [uncultured Thermomicrobiales bacterium]
WAGLIGGSRGNGAREQALFPRARTKAPRPPSSPLPAASSRRRS